MKDEIATCMQLFPNFQGYGVLATQEQDWTYVSADESNDVDVNGKPVDVLRTLVGHLLFGAIGIT
jgi:hypothetical protein